MKDDVSLNAQVPVTAKDEADFLAKIAIYRKTYKDKFNPQFLPSYLQSIENFVKGRLRIQQGEGCLRSSTYDQQRKSKYRSRSPSSSPSRHSSRSVSSSPSPQSSFKRSKRARTKSRSRSGSPRRYCSKSRSRSSRRARSKNRSSSLKRDHSKSCSPKRDRLKKHSPKPGKKIVKEPKTSKITKHTSTSQTQSKIKQEKMDSSVSSVDSVPKAPTLLASNSSLKTDDLALAESKTSVFEIDLKDFKPASKKEKFTNSKFKIYFTPCFKTLFANIRRAIKELQFHDEMIQAFTEMDATEHKFVWRTIEASAFLVCGQSLIASVKTIRGKSNVCIPLEKNAFSILRPLYSIVSQYGEVQSDSSLYLCSIDHDSDIRAIIRLVDQLLLKIFPTEEDNAIEEERVRQSVFRSWLPTSNKDRRFLWILACRISSLMNKKIGYAPTPQIIIEAFQRKTQPLWWNRQLSQCFSDRSAIELLDFLFTDYWTKEIFYTNFAQNSNSSSLLNQLDLEWKNPLLCHLAWEENAIQDQDVINRISEACNLISNEIFSTYNFPLVSQLFPRDHLGSWHQIQEANEHTFFGIGETNSNKRELCVRYPPKAITESLDLFYSELESK